LPPAARLDGSDPKAFLDTLLGRLGVDLAALPADKQAEFLDNDFLALAAAQGDCPSLEDALRTMRMPCFLYRGGLDGGVLAEMQRCAKEIAHSTFMSFANLTHPEALYRADIVLPSVMRFLRSFA
jgi:hypothetical protein